jgi:hypothetical protein
MELVKQACTRKQAQKLREMGIGQDYEGQLVWIENEFLSSKRIQSETWHLLPRAVADDVGFNQCCNAFTVAELGQMLPDMIVTERQYELWCIKEDDCWLTRYIAGNDVNNYLYKNASVTEAESRAEMLIYLMTDKRITADEANARLRKGDD